MLRVFFERANRLEAAQFSEDKNPANEVGKEVNQFFESDSDKIKAYSYIGQAQQRLSKSINKVRGFARSMYQGVDKKNSQSDLADVNESLKRKSNEPEFPPSSALPLPDSFLSSIYDEKPAVKKRRMSYSEIKPGATKPESVAHSKLDNGVGI